MPKHLLLAGGGHAHMMTLANLHHFVEQGHRVTVVQPSEHHYYSGMGPGMLGGTYAPEEIRFATRRVVEKQGGTFILDKVTGIDPEACSVTLASGNSVNYDVLSVNTGSSVPDALCSGINDRVFTVKPIERLHKARQIILELAARKPLRIGVIGGGPSAVEIAGNIRGLTRKDGLHPVTVSMFARSTIMTSFPDGVRARAIRSLRSNGIKIIEYSEVK